LRGGYVIPEPDDIETYHPPATTALVPGPLRFVAAPAAVAAAIVRALGVVGRVEEISGGAATRFFRVLPESGRALFVKRVAPANLESQQRSDALARWLANRGVRTLPSVQHIALGGSGDVLFVYPWLDWRAVRATEADLVGLGNALAGLHAALENHPDTGAWRGNTDRRLARLSRIRDDIAKGRLVPRLHGATLARLCRRPDSDFTATEGRRPLHGDLHLFNVLIPAEATGGPVFIDFEDAKHSVLPTRFELGLVVERAILNQEADDTRAAALAGVFVDRYFGDDPAETRELKRQMTETLRALSLRSLCVIVDSEANGIAVESAEWDKFIRLFAQAERRAHAFS
jgi:Ser/Thr protein kinase RdoA (MazF antagonist)